MAALVLAALVLGACDGALPDRARPSNGDPGFRLAERPSLAVGLEEPVLLHRVAGAVLFGEGIAIANAGTSEILLVDGAGRLEGRRGGPGAGPGEFGNLAGLVRQGTGLLALDARWARLNRLDDAGRHEGSFPLSIPDELRSSYGRVRLLGALTDQALLEIRRSPVLPGAAVFGPLEARPEVGFWLISTAGGEITWRGAPRPGREIWLENRGPMGPFTWLEIPFGRDAAAAAAGGHVYLADTDSPEVIRVGEAGEAPVRLFPHEPITVPREWDHFVRDTIRARTTLLRAQGEASGDPGDLRLASADFREDLLRSLPARATLPAFEAMLGGLEGHLWLRLPGDPAGDVVWAALDRDLREVRRVRIPRSFEVLDLSLDRVLVLRRTEMQEEVVEVYPVVP